MESKQKLITALLIIFTLFFVGMIISTTLNFRHYGMNTAEQRASLTAEIVKIGLTSHMVNGIMDQRDYFLTQISSVQNINELWIARSPTVIKQYGEGHNNEIPRDKIDAEVLKTGVQNTVTTETTSKSLMRVTIPFVASSFGTPNCMQCHEAKEGEVLGAVSMVMDITEIRTSSLKTVSYNVALTLITIFFVFVIMSKFVKPYVSIFYSIKEVMQSTLRGDYSGRVRSGMNSDSRSVATLLNSMLEKLQYTFEELDKKVYVFIKNKNYVKEPDPLKNINTTIERLSDIYKFKQTIENDKELEDIYNRIAYVLKHHFKLEDFTMTEIDMRSKVKKIVYSETGCHCDILNGECRADRINASVDSSIFANSCELYKLDNSEYICSPYHISNDLELIVTIVTTTEEQTDYVRKIMSDIEDYITTARPAIVSKKLMQTLNQMARVDQLTGMYNRKFLDEFADISIPQSIRAGTTYGVLMIDIDYFKMINDTYGHDIGDEAIRIVSGVIKKQIRKADIAIRYGGEEFLVLLYNCAADNIVIIADSIRTEFAKQKISSSNTETFSKTLSVGCSRFPQDSDSIWKCIKFADISLYAAKEGGRNKVVAFTPQMLEDKEVGESF